MSCMAVQRGAVLSKPSSPGSQESHAGRKTVGCLFGIPGLHDGEYRQAWGRVTVLPVLPAAHLSVLSSVFSRKLVTLPA